MKVLKRQSYAFLLLCALPLKLDAFAPQSGKVISSSIVDSSQVLNPGKSWSPRQRSRNTALCISQFQDTLKEVQRDFERSDNAAALFRNLKRTLTFSESELGLLVLLTVPIAWGSYGPFVSSLLSLEPKVPGFIFSTCYFFVSAVASLWATFSQSARANERDGPEFLPVQAGLELGGYVYCANFLHVIGLQSVPADKAGFLFQLTTVMVPLLEAMFARNLLAIPGTTWAACALALGGIFVMGMESPFGEGDTASEVVLSSSNQIDQVMQVGSDNVDTVITGTDLGTATQAVLDASQMAMDAAPQAVADSGSSLLGMVPTGEALIVGAAFLYSLQILRLSRWSRDYSPLQIMTGKTVAESVFSALFLGGATWLASNDMDVADNAALKFLQQSGEQATDFFQTVSEKLHEGTIPASTVEHFVGTTIWTGLVTTCYLVFAQSYGQQRVKASDANLIYSLQPLFTAVFAYYLLGETLQPMGFLGGALIGSGVYLVASKSLDAKDA